MSIKKYLQYKEEVERYQREVDQILGAKKELEKQLKEQFGCGIEEARKLLKKKEKEYDLAEEEFNRSMEEFEKKWNLSGKL